ncbi:hypothetical protein QJS04_geneDACA006139 [Acorus gramineus]|uniref:FRIGIDA-like protein n=1 Tax=Acorus gramineus TaxID=55184 RepID=A0AAV9B137_ACOGR|nr:hypothetical protein QJS04_geneDACA006139 [Acorus gramineus]
MDDAQSVATLLDSATSKIQQLQQAFAELESYRAVSLNLKWKELEEHFHGLERSLKKRFEDLKDQEKMYETKELEAHEMLMKREAAVAKKECVLLGRLQEKRNAAVLEIGEAHKRYKKASGEPVINIMGNGKTDAIVEEKLEMQLPAKVDSETVKPTENGDIDVKARPKLMELCEEMNAKGLHKFVSDNRKDLSSIREEIPVALKSSSDPFRLVLNSLEDFYSPEALTVDGKKDVTILGVRRTCITLMESLSALVADTESDELVVPSDVKECAKLMAMEWKSKLGDVDIDASAGNSLEAHAFLQLLATFGITSEFDQEGICKLIPSVSRRRQAAGLCRSLGLKSKMPGVIEVMANSGRQIDAVNLACELGMTKQFDPVNLLKSYLKEARKPSQVKAGNMSPGIETSERELNGLKAVIRCIEDHKLEEQYPLDPLQKRVLQIEKDKADKKRATEAMKPQPKRPRANGIITYPPRVTNVIPDNKCMYRGPERYPDMYKRPPHPFLVETHGSPLLGSHSYNFSTSHGGYYGNGYQYQIPYIH